jgi:putative PIN family toxin of toxin-antitoxin system
MNKQRFVLDTNVLVSRLLVPHSVTAQAVRLAVNQGLILLSTDTLVELSAVFSRQKFDAYVSVSDRQKFIDKLRRIGEKVDIFEEITMCRDPKDDKFLELAVNGNANVIITGDKDLLVLHPFRGIAILNPPQFLSVYGEVSE